MALIAMCSARGSPGVTTAALAMTMTWPSRCVLVECDPAGGTVLAGYLQGTLGDDRGIRELAVAELRGESLQDAWWSQLIDLQAPYAQRLLLPGITDPVQSGALRPLWDRFAEFFATLPDIDVVVDCGRLVTANAPLPLLASADVVLLTLRPDLPGMAAALPAVRSLREHLRGARGGHDTLRLLLTGGGDQSRKVVAREMDTPVAAVLPEDHRSARVLTHGGSVRLRAPLLQAAANVRQHVLPRHHGTLTSGAATHDR